MAKLSFDVNEVEPSDGGSPLPPGRYTLQVMEESLEMNSNRTGEVLKLTYEVLGPEQAGRRIWVNLNISHQNPVAQDIGKRELRALVEAIGEGPIEDTEELLWKPFEATTKIEIDKNSGKERAAVKKYLFGDALNAPAEKARPTPHARPTGATERPAGHIERPVGGTAQVRQGSGPSGGGAGGARGLPWQGRQGGGQQPPHQNNPPTGGASHDPYGDIPF